MSKRTLRVLLATLLGTAAMWPVELFVQRLLMFRTGAYSLAWHVQTEFHPSQLLIQAGGVALAAAIVGALVAAIASVDRPSILAALAVAPWAVFAFAAGGWTGPSYPSSSWQTLILACALPAAVSGAALAQSLRRRVVAHAA